MRRAPDCSRVQTLPIFAKRSRASCRPASEKALRPAVVCSKPRPAVPVNSAAPTTSPVSVRTARAETFATAEKNVPFSIWISPSGFAMARPTMTMSAPLFTPISRACWRFGSAPIASSFTLPCSTSGSMKVNPDFSIRSMKAFSMTRRSAVLPPPCHQPVACVALIACSAMSTKIRGMPARRYAMPNAIRSSSSFASETSQRSFVTQVFPSWRSARTSPATAAWPTASVVWILSSARTAGTNAARARATAMERFILISLIREDDDLGVGEEPEVLAGEAGGVHARDDEVRALGAHRLHDVRLVADPLLQARLRGGEVVRVGGRAAHLAARRAERRGAVDDLAGLVEDPRRERRDHLLAARVDDERGPGCPALRPRRLRIGLRLRFRLRLRQERVRERALERHLDVQLDAAVREVARAPDDLEAADEPLDAARERLIRLERAADRLAGLELHALQRLHAVAERVELRRLLRADAGDRGVAGRVAEVRGPAPGAPHDLPLPVHAALGARGRRRCGAQGRHGQDKGESHGDLLHSVARSDRPGRAKILTSNGRRLPRRDAWLL